MLLVWGQLLVVLLPLLSSSAADSVERTAICLHHDEHDEIFLYCAQGLIHILEAQHGYVVGNNASNCTYQQSDRCAVPLPNMEYLRDHCMGKGRCTVGVSPLFLDPCGRESNYMQVVYSCVSGNTMDICGDNTQERTITAPSGYIVSINYPRPYSPDNTCSCTLSAPDNTHVVLYLLDLRLSSTGSDNWNSDWLEYSSKREDWGSGRVLGESASYNRTVNTGHQVVYLNFRSDHQRESRGFWLQYGGLTADGTQVPVSVLCQVYVPPAYKHRLVCFSDTNPRVNLDLSCRSRGVINVLHTRQGWRETSAEGGMCKRPDDMSSDLCLVHVQDDAMLDACSGKEACNVSVARTSLRACAHNASFLFVEYQCIQDVQDMGNIVDICGEQDYTVILERNTGFIKSNNYPQHYSAGTNCSCMLETVQIDSTIILTVLDLRLQDTSNCDRDWLKYRSPMSKWGQGVNMCRQTVREKIFTKQNILYIDFHADSKSEQRGFWIKYEGRRPDGFKAAVKLHCGNYLPELSSFGLPRAALNTSHGSTVPVDSVTLSPVPSGTGKQGAEDSRHASTGLIVGLMTSAFLVLMIIAVVIFRKHRKAQTSKLPSMSTPSSYGAAIDSNFSVLSKRAGPTYSTLNDSVFSRQVAMPGNQPGATTPGTQPSIESNDDEVVSYLKPPPKERRPAPPSFVNPTYIDTPDDATSEERYYTVNI